MNLINECDALRDVVRPEGSGVNVGHFVSVNLMTSISVPYLRPGRCIDADPRGRRPFLQETKSAGAFHELPPQSWCASLALTNILELECFTSFPQET